MTWPCLTARQAIYRAAAESAPCKRACLPCTSRLWGKVRFLAHRAVVLTGSAADRSRAQRSTTAHCEDCLRHALVVHC